VGFLFALWSGSRAVNVFVDTISIMYGLGGIRGIVRARLKSLGLHLVTLLLGVISLPLLVLGPDLARRVLPSVLDWMADLTWPVALLAGMLLLATLYHTATPVRSRWARDLPGAALALLIWLGASVGLRVVVSYSVSEGVSIYGPLTAVIVLLIWLYALALAVLIGAGLNAAVDQLWPVPARVAAREARDGTAQR
jgi:membrane protein